MVPDRRMLASSHACRGDTTQAWNPRRRGVQDERPFVPFRQRKDLPMTSAADWCWLARSWRKASAAMATRVICTSPRSICASSTRSSKVESSSLPPWPISLGHVESFTGKLRDECLNETLFTSLWRARVVLPAWPVGPLGLCRSIRTLLRSPARPGPGTCARMRRRRQG